MRAKNLKEILQEIPDDAEIAVAGIAYTEEIIGVVQDLVDDDYFLLIVKPKAEDE